MPAASMDGTRRLTAVQRRFVLACLASYHRPFEVKAEFEERFGCTVSEAAISAYRDKPKWSGQIAELRKTLDVDLIDIPISSKYWRMAKRMKVLDMAMGSKGELSVARGVLLDAAREMGAIHDQGGKGPAVNVNLIMNQIEGLSPEMALEYAKTGELPAATWTADVIDAEPVNRAVSGESESVDTKVEGTVQAKLLTGKGLDT